jgi:coenzyme PQQ precursor peptide PqqA
MSLSTDRPTDIEKPWKTPTFQEIPISFEASSYALSDDDDPLIR